MAPSTPSGCFETTKVSCWTTLDRKGMYTPSSSQASHSHQRGKTIRWSMWRCLTPSPSLDASLICRCNRYLASFQRFGHRFDHAMVQASLKAKIREQSPARGIRDWAALKNDLEAELRFNQAVADSLADDRLYLYDFQESKCEDSPLKQLPAGIYDQLSIRDHADLEGFIKQTTCERCPGGKLPFFRHNRTIDWDCFAPEFQGDIDSASVFVAENLEAEYLRLRIAVKAGKETLPLKTPQSGDAAAATAGGGDRTTSKHNKHCEERRGALDRDRVGR